PRVYYTEVLMGYFGWKRSTPLPRNPDAYEGPGTQLFSRREIGEKTYGKVMATLSRACARLGDRGLVTCLYGKHSHWSGVQITDKGTEWLWVTSQGRDPES